MESVIIDEKNKRLWLYANGFDNHVGTVRYVGYNVTKNPNGTYEIIINICANDYILVTADRLVEG